MLNILGHLTSIDCPAVLSITFVNAALVVSPVEPASGNVTGQGHRVRRWSVDNFKLLGFHIQQPDRAPLHRQQSGSITWTRA